VVDDGKGKGTELVASLAVSTAASLPKPRKRPVETRMKARIHPHGKTTVFLNGVLPLDPYRP